MSIQSILCMLGSVFGITCQSKFPQHHYSGRQRYCHHACHRIHHPRLFSIPRTNVHALNRFAGCTIIYTKVNWKGKTRQKHLFVRSGHEIVHLFDNLRHGRMRVVGNITIHGPTVPTGLNYIYLHHGHIVVDTNRPNNGWRA